MSELKSHDLVDIQDYRGEVYLKSEADKVIAEKDKEIEEQKRLRDMALASVPNVIKVMKIIQHHKYKRCLAMAKWCDTKGDWYYSLGEHFRDCVDFYIKWRDKWLKITDKFKEAK